ncbi:MAG: GNAT family N-acetyltransferase [Rhodoglobus sp.]
MPTYRATPVTDATAQVLLAEYFAFRAAAFPVPDGYRAVQPDPVAFNAPNGAFVVVREFGEAIGCGGVRALDEARFEVKHLWLRPLARGRGLGRALLHELERRAVALGASELVLDTHYTLEAAGELYRSSGYHRTESYNENPNATDWYFKRLAT